MSNDDDFRIRPGKIRSRANMRAKPFIAQALAAAERAGGHVSRSGKIAASRHSRFGRGRVASVRANRLLTSRSRLATVKTRIVRNTGRRTTLRAHLNYLRREGVTRDGERARMFGADTDEADVKAFSERCEEDRHHFRIIVSPEDAAEISDLKAFARDLMRQAEKDLGTKLDWVGVDHWNTDNPHVHMLLPAGGFMMAGIDAPSLRRSIATTRSCFEGALVVGLTVELLCCLPPAVGGDLPFWPERRGLGSPQHLRGLPIWCFQRPASVRLTDRYRASSLSSGG